MMAETKLDYEIDDKGGTVKVFYPRSFTKEERERQSEEYSQLARKAKALGLKIFLETFGDLPSVSNRAILTQNDTICGIEVYLDLEALLLLDDGIKSKAYVDFTMFQQTQEPEYLPGALQFAPMLRQEKEVNDIIQDLQTTIEIGGKEGEEAKKLLGRISRALIPDKKRGVKPEVSITSELFLEILKDIKELKAYLQNKRYRKERLYEKKKQIQEFYYKYRGLRVDEDVIEESSVTNTVPSIHAWKLREMDKHSFGTSFETLRRKFKKIKTLMKIHPLNRNCILLKSSF